MRLTPGAEMDEHVSRARSLALVLTCVLMNLGLGALVAAVKLPFYLDSIGTVLGAYLGGLWVGVAVAVLSVLIGSLYSPTLWAYAGTAVLVAGYVRVVTPWGYLRSVWRTAAFGLLLGGVAAVASAPVTVLVWQGASLTGADVVTAFFSAAGQTLADSVVLGGLSTDPVDKLLTSLVALAVVRRVPRRWRPGDAAGG